MTHALAKVTVPAAVVDQQGRIRWLNRGARDVVGNRVGEPFPGILAPEDRQIARAHFVRKLTGQAALTEYNATLLARNGRRVAARISSVPFWESGEIRGVFGLACLVGVCVDADARSILATSGPELTARQYETLALLAEGLGTTAIASRLGVAEETARNHIRGLFRQLSVHSRLEAVVRAYRLGLLRPRLDE